MLKRASWAAAALLLSIAAGAARPDSRVTPKSKAMGACECLRKKGCWKLVREAFGQNSLNAKKEVEASAPGGFFKNSAAFALEKPDDEGHFLSLQCRPNACPADDREELERRFVVTTFLVSVPLGLPRSELFDEDTWVTTEKAEKIFVEAKLCKPRLLVALIDVIHASRAN